MQHIYNMIDQEVKRILVFIASHKQKRFSKFLKSAVLVHNSRLVKSLPVSLRALIRNVLGSDYYRKWQFLC